MIGSSSTPERWRWAWKEGGHRARFVQRSCSRNIGRVVLILLSPLVSAAVVYTVVSLLNREELHNASSSRTQLQLRVPPSNLEQRYLIQHRFNSSFRAVPPPAPDPIPFWAPDLEMNQTIPNLPLDNMLPIVVNFTNLETPAWDKETATEMRFNYLSDEKKLPYVGAKIYTSRFENHTRRYYNSLAVFPGSSQTPVDPLIPGSSRMHGWLGVNSEGRRLWVPTDEPPPVKEYPGGLEAALKNGGFYLNLSNALPVDRPPPDNREPVCRAQSFDLSNLPDASIVITFYNEPLSTLLRTVHSVLNNSPPPILREIILVDDHSNLTENLPGSPLYRYIDYLPKVKLMRLGYRRGLVHARLAGARVATGQVLVVLDSHIEVNPGWLEPQLARLAEKPDSIVFPQILAINPETFEYDTKSGIGCKVTFRWSMVEQSSMASRTIDPSPIPSPSMAGGLFAADLDYFWHIGGYDEGFSMWGAENVEMGFRTWQCGGRLECMPCAKTYHIYRKKGHGYESPHDAIVRNRLRAARVWTDEFFAIARLFIGGPKNPDTGSLDKMLSLKERLNCKPFKWFLDTVDPGHDIQSISSIEYHGELRSLNPLSNNYCLDTMSHTQSGDEYNIFPCHGEGGTQNWVKLKERDIILPVSNERLCISNNLKFHTCKDINDRSKITWKIENIINNDDQNDDKILIKNNINNCLAVKINKTAKIDIQKCDLNNSNQWWKWKLFKPEPVQTLKYSDQYLKKLSKIDNRSESEQDDEED